MKRSKKGAGRRGTCRSGKPERVYWEIQCRGNLEPSNTEYFSSSFSYLAIYLPLDSRKRAQAGLSSLTRVSESHSVVSQLFCDPMDYTVHGIVQARILEWVAFPFSRGSSQPKAQTQVCCIEGDSLPAEPPGKPSQE